MAEHGICCAQDDIYRLFAAESVLTMLSYSAMMAGITESSEVRPSTSLSTTCFKFASVRVFSSARVAQSHLNGTHKMTQNPLNENTTITFLAIAVFDNEKVL